MQNVIGLGFMLEPSIGPLTKRYISINEDYSKYANYSLTLATAAVHSEKCIIDKGGCTKHVNQTLEIRRESETLCNIFFNMQLQSTETFIKLKSKSLTEAYESWSWGFQGVIEYCNIYDELMRTSGVQYKILQAVVCC